MDWINENTLGDLKHCYLSSVSHHKNEYNNYVPKFHKAFSESILDEKKMFSRNKGNIILTYRVKTFISWCVSPPVPVKLDIDSLDHHGALRGEPAVIDRAINTYE